MKPFFKKVFFILLISFSFLACSSNTNKAAVKTEPNLEKGKVIDKVSCKKDLSTNYALYLPSKYDSTKKYPVIIAFDSHACGTKPVNLFKDEAEKYGYIVVGSNNSKNGTAWPTTNAIYNAMLTDVLERFSIDKKRIYTAGFSGGSRVASTIAIQNGGIAGVVGFSAGFPGINQPISNKFDFLGIVGNADFNFNEMTQLDKYLESVKFVHYLLVFNGKHEWPSQEIIPDVFSWLEFCAMRNKWTNLNNVVINEFTGKYAKEIENKKAKNDIYGEYLICEKIVRFLDGVGPIDVYKTRLTELQKTPAVQNELKAIETDVNKEQTLQENYSKAMNTNDEKWWTAEVKKINDIIKQNKNVRECLIYKRIFSFLSIGAYTYSNNALKSNQLSEAQRFITIYTLVDPENSETAYFQAILYARKNENEKAMKSLEDAVNLGFNDVGRMQADTSISKLTSMKEYYQLIDKMKAKK